MHHVAFSILTLMVLWSEGHPARNKTISLIRRGSVPEKVEEEDPMENGLTSVNVDKQL